MRCRQFSSEKEGGTSESKLRRAGCGSGGYSTVQFQSATAAIIMTSLSLNTDDRVSARQATKYPKWQCKWYLGHIVAVHEDGTYDILFDDGDRESRVGSISK